MTEEKKKNAEVTKLVDSIVNQPPREAVTVEDGKPVFNKVKPYVKPGESEGGLGELLMKHKEDFKQQGTIKVIPAYEMEITAIGVLLRNLAPLDHETRTRVLSYAMQWVDDQRGVKTDER